MAYKRPQTKQLKITKVADQDSLPTCAPVIGVEIWEHALMFHLRYLNVKADISSFL